MANLAAKIKGAFSRMAGRPADKPAAPEGEGGSSSPYLNARRAWNEHTGGIVRQRDIAAIIGMGGMLVGVLAVGGDIYRQSQSQFVPYVVEVDKLGQSMAVHVADRASAPDSRVIRAAVSNWIANARLVSVDVQVQRKAIFSVYALLNKTDPATQRMTDYLDGTPEASPFKRAATELVSVEIESVLPQTDATWEVTWKETVRERQGGSIKGAHRWRALITVYHVPPTPETTEEEIRANPAGIFVRDFSWTRLG